MLMNRIKWALGVLATLALLAGPAQAQNITAPPPTIPDGITVQEIKVHGMSLMGNLEGNEVDRQVMVVLPPSYATSLNKRYPVVYYLHGFAIDGKQLLQLTCACPKRSQTTPPRATSSLSWSRAR
jgi:poly(3-hydroxybutyrate) depolymerase